MKEFGVEEYVVLVYGVILIAASIVLIIYEKKFGGCKKSNTVVDQPRPSHAQHVAVNVAILKATHLKLVRMAEIRKEQQRRQQNQPN